MTLRASAPSGRLRRVRLLSASAHPSRAASALATAIRWAARARHGVLFYPVILSAVGVVGAHALLAVDRRLPVAEAPVWATLTPSAATTLLATLAGALITVVGLLFWVRAAQVSLAATQFSARMLTGYLGDRRLQLTMGFVIGTFAYVVAVLAHIPAPAEGEPGLVPDLAVAVAVVSVLTAVLRIVAAVMHGARMTHASEIVDTIAQATVARIRRDGVPGVSADDEDTSEGVRALPDLDARAAVSVEAPASGWVRDVDEEALLAALAPAEVVSLRVRLGEFVTEGQTVAKVWPCAPAIDDTAPASAPGAGSDPEVNGASGAHGDLGVTDAPGELTQPEPAPEPTVDHEAIAGALTVGSSRSVATDVSYGIAQLVDVVQRSLAPGNNDLTAASEAIQRLGVVLRELLIRDDHATSRVDEHRRWVLRPRELGSAGYLKLAFERVRIDGATYPSVTAELLGTLGMLRAAALRAGRGDRAVLCAKQARRLLASATQSGTSEEDQSELLVRAHELGLVDLDAPHETTGEGTSSAAAALIGASPWASTDGSTGAPTGVSESAAQEVAISTLASHRLAAPHR